jgi:hypothetical protein
MLQLIEKILLEACESKNDNAAIDAFKKMRSKRSASEISFDDAGTFNKMCCYAIHELYYLIGIETNTGVKVSGIEESLVKLLIHLLFIVEKSSSLKKYLAININNLSDRVHRYRKIAERIANEDGYIYYEPNWISQLVYQLQLDNCCNGSNGSNGSNKDQPTQITNITPTTKSTISSKYVDGRQLVTIKTVIEQEISMYVDVDIQCPKYVKIYMPHLEEPIYISRVIKKYIKFAKLFDGKSKENTLSYYYKFNKNESVLEFIDEDMESEVAELLGVNIIEKEIIDEELALEEAAKKNTLTADQVSAFKEQLDEVRWSIKHAV